MRLEGTHMTSAKLISPLTYVGVLTILVLLTLLTVGLSFIDVSGEWHVVFGLSIGFCKAALVGLFFMHLIHSRPTTWAVVIVSLFWVGVVLCMLAFSDYAARSAFPFVPGH
jgi:cytochrome c oxidase subunit 4